MSDQNLPYVAPDNYPDYVLNPGYRRTMDASGAMMGAALDEVFAGRQQVQQGGQAQYASIPDQAMQQQRAEPDMRGELGNYNPGAFVGPMYDLPKIDQPQQGAPTPIPGTDGFARWANGQQVTEQDLRGYGTANTAGLPGQFIPNIQMPPPSPEQQYQQLRQGSEFSFADQQYVNRLENMLQGMDQAVRNGVVSYEAALPRAMQIMEQLNPLRRRMEQARVQQEEAEARRVLKAAETFRRVQAGDAAAMREIGERRADGSMVLPGRDGTVQFVPAVEDREPQRQAQRDERSRTRLNSIVDSLRKQRNDAITREPWMATEQSLVAHARGMLAAEEGQTPAPGAAQSASTPEAAPTSPAAYFDTQRRRAQTFEPVARARIEQMLTEIEQIRARHPGGAAPAGHADRQRDEELRRLIREAASQARPAPVGPTPRQQWESSGIAATY